MSPTAMSPKTRLLAVFDYDYDLVGNAKKLGFDSEKANHHTNLVNSRFQRHDAVVRHLVAISFSAILLQCSASEPDPRVASPQATVETLLRANHLWRVSLFEARLPRPPPDVAVVASCFWDYDRDDQGSRAMGEFVAGMLAAGQGQLEYYMGQRQTIIRTRNRPVYLRVTGQQWLIVLRDTVPEEIREGLRHPVRRPEQEFGHEMP